jgi:sugar lactone lactonase YvrE
MTGHDPQVLLSGLLFPESPRWHDEALWFSDMYARRVVRLEGVTGSPQTVVEVLGRPSGLGWLPDGRLLVVSMAERRLLRLEKEGLVVHAELAGMVTGDANDMVVDGVGRAFVGNFGFGYAEGTAPQPTNLVCVEPDGTVRVVAENLFFPNGSVISPDARRLIVAEGFAQRLTEFAIEPDGRLSSRSVFADLAGEIPDGITLDAEGGVWAALPLRQEFIRVEKGGNVTDRISVSPRGAFACMLGGHDRRTLFLCATYGGEEEIRTGESKGEILTVRVQIPGVGWP